MLPYAQYCWWKLEHGCSAGAITARVDEINVRELFLQVSFLPQMQKIIGVQEKYIQLINSAKRCHMDFKTTISTILLNKLFLNYKLPPLLVPNLFKKNRMHLHFFVH